MIIVLIVNDIMLNCSVVLMIIFSDFDYEIDFYNLLFVFNKVIVLFNEINVVKMLKFLNLSIFV